MPEMSLENYYVTLYHFYDNESYSSNLSGDFVGSLIDFILEFYLKTTFFLNCWSGNTIYINTNRSMLKNTVTLVDTVDFPTATDVVAGKARAAIQQRDRQGRGVDRPTPPGHKDYWGPFAGMH